MSDGDRPPGWGQKYGGGLASMGVLGVSALNSGNDSIKFYGVAIAFFIGTIILFKFYLDYKTKNHQIDKEAEVETKKAEEQTKQVKYAHNREQGQKSAQNEKPGPKKNRKNRTNDKRE